jgi:hypothetical protein
MKITHEGSFILSASEHYQCGLNQDRFWCTGYAALRSETKISLENLI